MEGSCDYITSNNLNNNVHTNGISHSYPPSECGADGYDGSESGVEPDYSEWIFDSSLETDDILFDMSDEQAMAALRYFTSTATRTNMLTKTHSNDLELIAQLLSDKEKDLEMTAKIGQSLLQRNKQLMMKIETMEDYLSQTNENAAQLEHDLQMKSKLVELYAQDDEVKSEGSNGSKEDRCFDDQELINLTNRCRKLEKDNQNLFSEALNLRQMTDEMEDKEESLVMDCIEQLASTKQQITQLTDEIALKFEDNLQQQMEISQLINMVVELQKKQKQLLEENEGLQEQLLESTESQETLREQLYEMQTKFRETKELMLEHQVELKSLKCRLDSADNPCDWLSDSGNSVTLQDSLANEIEESVRRGLTSSLEKEKSKINNRKLLENVRHLNVRSESTSGRTSPGSIWSLASDERSESLSLLDVDTIKIRKPTRKLQIVKPMEGSDTLNKWHHLASKNIKGGLDVSSEEKAHHGEEECDKSIEDNPFPVDEMSNHETSTDDGISVNFPTTNTKAGKESSRVKPVPKPRPRVLSDLSTPQKRTIITRNSTALKSLRQGRKMLNSPQKGGRSQADVIGLIATAIGKVNVEAKAEQRILSSLTSPITPNHEREMNLADYKNMPNVAKALEKAAQINEKELRFEIEESSECFHDSRFENDDSSMFDSGAEEMTYSTITSSSEYNVSTHTSSTLHSISGPLGLLNRAVPSEPSQNIMDDILRYSGTQTQSKPSIVVDCHDENDTEIAYKDRENNTPMNNWIRHRSNVKDYGNGEKRLSLPNVQTDLTRSSSGGSLADMVVSKNLKARSLGYSNSVSRVDTTLERSLSVDNYLTIDRPEPELEVDDKTRTSVPGTTANVSDTTTASQPIETGRDTTTDENNGGIFGFFSFLGKLS